MSFDDLPEAEISFTVAELARLWRCSRAHIYNLINDGLIETFTIGEGPRGIRIRLEEKHRWENRQRPENPPSDDEEKKPSSTYQLKALANLAG